MLYTIALPPSTLPSNTYGRRLEWDSLSALALKKVTHLIRFELTPEGELKLLEVNESRRAIWDIWGKQDIARLEHPTFCFLQI